MNVVSKVGAVDIIVVKQRDGTFESSSWYVRFSKGFRDGIVRTQVNGVEADFHIYNSRRAYFVPQVHRFSPTNAQIASLNLKEGQNMVSFISSTRLLGSQKVEAHIYLWKWNTSIVICDIDGTITRSDVRGQIMPFMGIDWTHSGIARLLSAINENGYQILYLSARPIVQADCTRSFLCNLKQDDASLPIGPLVISPDSLCHSLYRKFNKRAHKFKIACLKDIKAIFLSDDCPFYAGFGNNDRDEFSYQKVGIPNDKNFIINTEGELTTNDGQVERSYTSLLISVNNKFPPASNVRAGIFSGRF